MDKTPGQVLFDECVARKVQVTCADVGVFHELAAAVIAHHEAAQLMTWDEAMAWATEGGACRFVLGYWPERFMWFMMSPETGYNCNTGRPRFTGSFTDGHRHVWSPGELTHFRKLPPAPEGGRR